MRTGMAMMGQIWGNKEEEIWRGLGEKNLALCFNVGGNVVWNGDLGLEGERERRVEEKV